MKYGLHFLLFFLPLWSHSYILGALPGANGWHLKYYNKSTNLLRHTRQEACAGLAPIPQSETVTSFSGTSPLGTPLHFSLMTKQAEPQ